MRTWLCAAHWSCRLFITSPAFAETIGFVVVWSHSHIHFPRLNWILWVNLTPQAVRYRFVDRFSPKTSPEHSISNGWFRWNSTYFYLQIRRLLEIYINKKNTFIIALRLFGLLGAISFHMIIWAKVKWIWLCPVRRRGIWFSSSHGDQLG